jgi:hypothetical protein
MATSVDAVSDLMAEAFVILGGPDACRKRVAEVWDVADSFCLCPPMGGLARRRLPSI